MKSLSLSASSWIRGRNSSFVGGRGPRNRRQDMGDDLGDLLFLGQVGRRPLDVELRIHDLVVGEGVLEHLVADVRRVGLGPGAELVEQKRAADRELDHALVRFTQPEIAGRAGEEVAFEELAVILDRRKRFGPFGQEFRLGLRAGRLGELGHFVPAKLEDGPHLPDGRLGVFLGRGLEVLLGLLDEAGEGLGPLGRALHPGVDRGELLGQELADAFEDDLVVDQGIELLGDDPFEAEHVEIEPVAEHVEVDLLLRAELVPGDLVDELGVDLVHAVEIFLDRGLGEVLEPVVVLVVAGLGRLARIEFPEGVEIVVEHLLELGVLGVLLAGEAGEAHERQKADQGEDRLFSHPFLLVVKLLINRAHR